MRPHAWIACAVLVAAPPASAQAPAPTASAQAPAPPSREQYRLDNGLEVVLLPDHATQVVAVEVWYEAGSRHDPAGRAGLARLFEQLMFAGSTHVPPGGHARIVEDVGGRLVAEVDEEVARFGEVLPSSRVSLGLWLEAERMRGVAIDDSVVATVVSGRLGQMADDEQRQPYRAALLTAIARTYDSTACTARYTPNGAETAAGTAAVRAADARAFFAAWYRAAAARLVVAGDFDPAAVKPLVQQYFAGIPAGRGEPDAPCREAAPASTRRIEMTDARVTAPAAGLFFPIPPHDNPDTRALELLEVIFSRGNLSRLSEVGAEGPSSGWQAGTLGLRRAPGVFGLFGVAKAGVSADSLAAWFAAQVAWATSGGPTEADLARARQVHWATVVSTMERPGDRARTALHAAAYHPALAAGKSPEETADTLSLATLQRVARTYFAPDRAVTLIVRPRGSP